MMMMSVNVSGGSSSSFPILHQPKVKVVSSPLSLPIRGSCKASSGSHKRNPDLSRQNKSRGFSTTRGRSRDASDQKGVGDINLSSKNENGPLLSISNNNPTRYHHSTASSPGKREKEIVELFRKVQAQLRHRAAIKEDNKIEAQHRQGEKGTVDSLLKLLRKHSADQGNLIQHQNSNTTHHQTTTNHSHEDQNSFFSEASSIAADDHIHEPEEPVLSTRPVSKFKRRSPVPTVKFQPVYSPNEDTNVYSPSKASGQTEEDEEEEEEIDSTQAELELEPVFFDERQETYEAEPLDSSNIEDVEGSLSTKSPDMSSMKLSELRVVAKSRGVKGYSKLKKAELVKLLEAM